MALANKHPWFAFYPRDYERDTWDLSLIEHGAYLKLMVHYYETTEPIPDDAGKLQKICRAHSEEELQAISRIISRFFVKKDDGYHHRRCDSEIRKARKISRVRRQARLHKRKTIVNQKPSFSAIQSQPQSQSHTQKERSTAKAADEKPENYFQLIFEHFKKRSGQPARLLSPRDWKLLDDWQRAGIPAEAVIRGIDATFDNYEKRGDFKKVNSISYCEQEVLEATRMAKVASVGAWRP